MTLTPAMAYLLGAVVARHIERELWRSILRRHRRRLTRSYKEISAAASEAVASMDAFASAMGDLEAEEANLFDQAKKSFGDQPAP